MEREAHNLAVVGAAVHNLYSLERCGHSCTAATTFPGPASGATAPPASESGTSFALDIFGKRTSVVPGDSLCVSTAARRDKSREWNVSKRHKVRAFSRTDHFMSKVPPNPRCNAEQCSDVTECIC